MLSLLATEAGEAAFHLEPGAATGVAAAAWLVPLLPLVGFAVLVLTARRWRAAGDAAGWFASVLVGASFALSIAIFVQLLGLPAEGRTLLVDVYTWVGIGELELATDILLDPLSVVMLLVVTGVGFLIHVYSIGYMHGDERFPRYFAYLNLFVFSMLVLVLASDYVVLFVGWELVGLCSYLLIGFWFEEMSNAVAAKKAMVVNRVGDVSFAIGLLLMFAEFGSLAFPEVLPQASEVLGGDTALATAIGLLLLGGAVGKSAQIPLYVWLPDAMAGPTPVSALIHAATMVTAGVYMIARSSPIYVESPTAMMIVAAIGVATALLAAVIAVQQDDIKKVLAYSTISQLGYMFVGVGVGIFGAGLFHLVTHAFFKALLFLAAGSVMHAVANRTDMWRMGGLRRIMPVTFWTSVIAWLAISGFPPFAGFFSKDQVLASAYDHGFLGIYIVGLLTAIVTAFYMTRWLVVIFLGDRRWDEGGAEPAHGGAAEGEGASPLAEPDAHAASDTSGHGTAPASERAGELHPHDPPWTMASVLVVLAVLSAGGGALNPAHGGPLETWLEPSLAHGPFREIEGGLGEPALIAISVVAAVLGIGAALLVYLRPAPRRDPLPARLGGLAAGMRRAFWVDEAYSWFFVRGGGAASRFLAWFDATVVDGAVNGLGRTTRSTAGALRRVQVGLIRVYITAMVVGTVLVVAVFLVQVA